MKKKPLKKIMKTEKHWIWLMRLVWVAYIGLLLSTVLLVRWYNLNLKPVDKDQKGVISFEVQPGDNWHEVAQLLEDGNLIKDAAAFKWHLTISNKRDTLIAGQYSLKQSMYASEIVEILGSGIVVDGLRITIFPSKRLDEIKDSLVEQGFKRPDIETAFSIDNYKNHALFIEHNLPKQSLEGYLFPETFFIHEYTLESAKYVVEQSLDAMEKQLSDNAIRSALEQNIGSLNLEHKEDVTGVTDSFDLRYQDITLYQAIILASIVEKEVEAKDRAQVAQVFLKRLQDGSRLDSDVTFVYASEIGDGPKNPGNPSRYNTRIHHGLPPSPISNVSLTSLQAVAYPATGDYSYFVSCDDGVTKFNRTLDEHRRSVEECCHDNCRLFQVYFLRNNLRQLIYARIS